MFVIDQIAETRIAEAIERGEFNNLPGAGKPLQLDDDSHVPRELRTAYRLLKNAGFVPPEVELRREIAQVKDLLTDAQDAREHGNTAKRLSYLNMRLNLNRRDKVDLRLEEAYYQKMQARLNTRKLERVALQRPRGRMCVLPRANAQNSGECA